MNYPKHLNTGECFTDSYNLNAAIKTLRAWTNVHLRVLFLLHECWGISSRLEDFALWGFCLEAANNDLEEWSGSKKNWKLGAGSNKLEFQLKENRSGTRVGSDTHQQQKCQKWKSLNICHRNEHAVWHFWVISKRFHLQFKWLLKWTQNM